ncbi:MAG: hypothetical protein ACRDLS_09730 [Solirubrobacteraceae bacterium]
MKPGWVRACAATVVVVAAAQAVAVDSAAGATTEIGAVAEIRAGTPPSPISAGGFAVQVAEATDTYAVPAGYRTITGWKHRAGTVSGPLTFKVYRPTGALREFLVVGSDTRMVTAGAVHSFAVQIPVQAGDRIGLSSDNVQLAYETFNLSDRIGFFGAEVPRGAIRATDGEPFEEFKLDVAATVTTGAGTPAPGTSPPAPELRLLSIKPRAFVAAKKGSSTRAVARRASGARVRYRLDVAAKVRFVVQRRRAGRRVGAGTSGECVAPTKQNRTRAKCVRYVAVKGSFSRSARAGSNRVYFTGRLGGRTLRPGAYRLVATPTADGVTGNTVRRSFRVIR